MTLRGLVPRINTLIDRTLYAMTAVLMTMLVVGTLAVGASVLSVPGWLVDPALVKLLPDVAPLLVLMLLQTVGNAAAIGLLRSKRKRAAAWLFFFVSALIGPVTAAFQPGIAIFTLIMMMMVVMVSVPHITKRDLIVMGVLGTFSIAAAAVMAAGPSVSLLHGPWPMTFRIMTLSLASGAGIFMFAILYQRTISGLRELDSANDALQETQARLRVEIAERTRAEMMQRRQSDYLAALSDTATALVRHQDRATLLRDILQRAGTLLSAQHTFVSLLNADESAQDIALSLWVADGRVASDHFSIPRGKGVIGQVWESGQIIAMPNYTAWSGRLASAPGEVHSVTIAPIKVADKVIGTVGFGFADPSRALAADELNIVERFSRLVSVALENTRLHEAAHNAETRLQQRVDERTTELNRLLAITNNLSSSLDMDVVMGRLFDELAHIVPYGSGAIFRATGADTMSVLYYRGPTHPGFSRIATWPISHHHAKVFKTRQPLFIGNVASDEPAAVEFRALGEVLHLDRAHSHIVSWIGVPIIVNDSVLGLLTFDSSTQDAFTPQHAMLAWSVAQQAGMALENARLHAQSVQAAASAERSRLARDLHDSVSQAVFSMALGARTMQQLAEIAPERVLEPLPHVIALAEAALTEMRALIFELRPESLQEEGLLAALRKHSMSLRARHGLEVAEDYCDAEPGVDIEVKEALYRIGLEAMHNAVKHARAKRMTVRVRLDSDQLTLIVEDDGVGFDTAGVPAGHYGLKTMRERVMSFGGTVHVESAPGAGARVMVVIPRRKAPVLARSEA